MKLAMQCLLVASGGATGALLRFALGRVQVLYAPAAGFPLATFTVNLLGCTLMGLFYKLLLQSDYHPMQQGLWLLLATGLLGGFTTFSAFALDSLQLLQKGQGGLAALYVGGTFCVTLLGVYLGWRIGGVFAHG